MSPPPPDAPPDTRPDTPTRTGDARALRIGALGGAVSALLFVLALLAVLALLGKAFRTDAPPSGGALAATTLAMYGLSVLVLPGAAFGAHRRNRATTGPVAPAVAGP